MPSNNKLIREAAEFAQKAHKDQTYGVYPYIKHLEDVYRILIRFGFEDDHELLMGAWLHDIIEDTDWKYQTVKSLFGLRIAEMVYGVTDELGRNRKERKKKTYPKIRDNIDSIILKLADRIANMEVSAKGFFGDPSKLAMYHKEASDFETELKHHYEHNVDNPKVWARIDKMWDYIDELLEENK